MQKLILYCLIFVTSGCSLSGRYYLRNLSDEPAVVTVLLNENLTTAEWRPTLLYDNRVREIRFGISHSFKQKLVVTDVDLYRVEFTIPPRSTVFIGNGYESGFSSGFEQAKIRIGSVEKSIILTQERELLNLRRHGFTKYTGHYDITLR